MKNIYPPAEALLPTPSHVMTATSKALESPGPLRLLPIFQIFKRTLGLRESPSGLGESRATEATANIKFFKRTLDLRESPSGLGESRATEAIVNITNFQKVTGPSGKSQWPERVPGH